MTIDKNYVDYPFNTRQTIISIGPGMLGIEKGIVRSGTKIKVAAYVEIEAFVIFNLIKAMEKDLLDSAPIWADIKTFPYRRFRKKIHGIISGYPCQPFSIAGNRKGAGDPRHIYPFISKAFQSIIPFWGFFENVGEHLNKGFEEVSHDLRKMGYLVEANLYSAQEVGATHERKRIFILAVKWEYAHYLRQFWNKRWSETEEFFKKSNPELANPIEQRRFEKQWLKTKLPTRVAYYESFEKWPLPPGPDQHEWEEPRCIKSRVGCTIDGYNFREDLLRMLGNGVVEQTSELAWIDLWNIMLNKNP